MVRRSDRNESPRLVGDERDRTRRSSGGWRTEKVGFRRLIDGRMSKEVSESSNPETNSRPYPRTRSGPLAHASPEDRSTAAPAILPSAATLQKLSETAAAWTVKPCGPSNSATGQLVGNLAGKYRRSHIQRRARQPGRILLCHRQPLVRRKCRFNLRQRSRVECFGIVRSAMSADQRRQSTYPR